MPLKLIGFIITLLIIVTFIGFNLDNSSDIKLWFGEKGLLTDVPIFISFFVMYLIGVLSVVPFLVSWKLKKRTSGKKVVSDQENSGKTEKKSVRVLGSRKRSKKVSENESETDPDNTEENSTESEESAEDAEPS
jgi:hypothetical protein